MTASPSAAAVSLENLLAGMMLRRSAVARTKSPGPDDDNLGLQRSVSDNLPLQHRRRYTIQMYSFPLVHEPYYPKLIIINSCFPVQPAFIHHIMLIPYTPTPPLLVEPPAKHTILLSLGRGWTNSLRMPQISLMAAPS